MNESGPADPNPPFETHFHPLGHFGPCDHCRARRFANIVSQLENKDDQSFLHHVYGELLAAEAIVEELDEDDEDDEIHFDTDISKESSHGDDDKETQV